MKKQTTPHNNTTSKKSKYKFSKGGFYAVIAACIIALGFTSLSAYNIISPTGDKAKNKTNYTAESAKNEDDSNVQNTPISEPDDSKNSEEQITESVPHEETSEAAVEAQFFVMPITGEILKNFSLTELQYSETYCDLRIHPALDIAAEKGTGITASGEGTVVSIENSPTHGNTVIIDHGNGITAKYCGLSEKVNISEGDVVDSETVIGTVGEIPFESVEKSHFHFEMYKNEEAVSPLVMFGME